nr:uncharacterized protein LOC123754168 [Procambarus clarkii]
MKSTTDVLQTAGTHTEPSTPAVVTATTPQPSSRPTTTLPSRNTASAFDATISSAEEVPVGIPFLPQRKVNYGPEDFLLDTTPTTSNDSTAMSTRSKTTKTSAVSKKTNDPIFLKTARKKEELCCLKTWE